MPIPTVIRLAAIAALLTPAAAALASTPPTGVWIDHTGRGAVEIKSCGNALCGRIVWLEDTKNASLCGKQIIGGVKHVGGSTWDKGWIYSPEENTRYDVELRTLKSGKLRVMGYAGVKFLSETMIWRPAPADLKRCDIKTASAPATAPSGKNSEAPAGSRDTAPTVIVPSPPSSPETTPTAPEKQRTRTSALVSPPEENRKAPPVSAKEQPDADVSAAPGKRREICRLELPYITLKFPCPD